MILRATETGQGPPVCLLHGLFGRAQNFTTLARTLAAGNRVICLDLRNHGASPHAAGMSYAEMAGDIADTLAALNALPCAVLGHSMGGKAAMMLALTRPAAVAGLLVADIAPVAYHHQNAAVAAAMQALDLRAGLERRQAETRLADAVPRAEVRAFLLQNLALGAAAAWKIGLSEIAAGIADIEGWPALPEGARYEGVAWFVRGGLSDYVSGGDMPQIEALFPRAQLITVSGAGHWLHAEAPTEFAAIVMKFLASIGATVR